MPISKQWTRYYNGDPERIAQMDPKADVMEKHDTKAGVLAFCDIEKDGVTFRIATTHFTWTPDGLPDAYQRMDLQAMLRELEHEGEFVLCGDFNAPRMRNGEPGEIFAAIAAQYTDNIPHIYESSIDGSLHRAGPLPYMVDGLFSTPGYQVSNVRLHTGVSDHCAITARIERG